MTTQRWKLAEALGDRLVNFAVRVMRLVEALPRKKSAKHCGDQLLRSGTSPGANYQEARAAESRADFVHKYQVALKELRESQYWLRLVTRAGFVSPEAVELLDAECEELIRIFVRSLTSARRRPSGEDNPAGGAHI